MLKYYLLGKKGRFLPVKGGERGRDKLDINVSPLTIRLKSIIDSNLNARDKQIQIENLIINYEKKYFKENINNPSIHSAILHNVYRDLRKGYF